jgi:hypothetical protein
VVDPEDHGGDRVEQAAERAQHDSTRHAHPRAVVVGEVGAAEGAEDHHPLETDVDHARALRPQAAEGGEQDRDDRDQGRADRA